MSAIGKPATGKPHIVEPATSDPKQIYRAGALAAFILGSAYLIIFPLYASVGAPPSGGIAWFQYLPGKTDAWWAILWISVFTDLLYVPLIYALYVALKGSHTNAMLLAAALVALFVVLDLAVTWSNYAAILTLFRKYASVTDDAQRSGLIAAANHASAVLTSPLEIVYAIVTLSSGILITGFVMLKSGFDKPTACLGIVTGVLGIASLTGQGVAIIGNALFATAWLFSVGYRLNRLARG